MESVSLSLPLFLFLPFLLLLTTTLAACVYRALASSYQKTADVEQFAKSCQAQTAEQAKSLRAQMEAAHAKCDSEKRANDSLRHEARTSLARREALATENARSQRDSQYHRDVNKALREELRAEKETTSAVERAQRIQNQWDSRHPGSANNTANGFDADPLSSLFAATSLGNEGTDQTPFFDYSAPGTQPGTNFTFDGDQFDALINNGGFDGSINSNDPNAYGGSANDGGSGNLTSSNASNDLSGLNNNNGGFTDTMDFSNFLQDLSELPVHEGWTDNGDFGDFSNVPDSSALAGFSGSDNNNGDLSSFADSSALGGASDFNNYNEDLSMFTDPTALNDFSGNGNPANLNPPNPPASTQDAIMPPPAPTVQFTFAPQGNLPTMADHQPLKPEEVEEIIRASEGDVDGVNAQELLEVMKDHEHFPRSDDDNGIDIKDLPPVVQREMLKYIRAQRKFKELKKPQGEGMMEE